MTDAEIRTLARGQYGSDDVEIDADAVVSHGDNPDDPGAFVAAWVWVRFPAPDDDDD